VIQAFTKDASKEPTVGYQYYLGSYGMRRADYQFSDTVGGYGLVADYGTFSTSGYRANSAAERKQFNGKLSFAPNAQTKVNVVFNRFDMPLAQDPLGLTRAQLTGDPTQAGNNSIGKFTRKVVLQNQLGSSAQTAIDADNALTARAYYGTRENLQYQASTTWVGLNRTYYGTGLQYNGRTQWQGIPLELAAGYEFDKSSERRQGGESVQGEKKSGSPTPLTRDEDNEAQNNDFFVQATAHVSEQISIVGGIRRSNIAFNSSDKFLSDTKDGSGSASFSATSPVLGITWHANNNLNLYINYGKGFESPTLAEMAYSGTTAPVALFNPLLNASSSQHYEIGAKWVPLRDARVDLAVYQIDSSDEIVTAASASGQTSFKNAPGTARTGWELAAASQLSEHLSARLSASSIDAKYSQTFKSSTTTIASGNKIPGIPDSSTFAEIAWTSEAFTNKTKAPLGSRVALEWQQAGRIFANDLNTESADGRNVFNVSLSQRWAWNQGLVTAYGRINNVSDVRYVGSVIVNQAASQFYEPAMPQNWMLGLSLSMPLR
jgi:iron complex outermembrane receptor protein